MWTIFGPIWTSFKFALLSKANLKVATLVLSEAVLLGGIGALLDECPKVKTK